jgi:hypothetical protein
MAGSKTVYLARKLLDHTLGGPAFTPPTTVYLCLSTAPFAPASTGVEMAEVEADDYARVPLVNDGTTWTTATGTSPSRKHNKEDLLYPAATSDWGTPQSAYLADALTGGNLLYGADITNPTVIGTGDTAKVKATAFVFQEV